MRTRFAGVIVLAAGVAAAISAASSVPLGNLILRSQPGAEVTWDGVNLGRTDEYGVMEIGDVPPGQYDLSFTRDGFEPLRVPMDVRAGSQSMTSLLTALPQTAEVPEDTVDNLHRTGQLPGFKVGKHLRWWPDSVRKFAEALARNECGG